MLARIPKGARYYLTIDIDGFDPSIAAGTGTPSHGGFLYYEILEFLDVINDYKYHNRTSRIRYTQTYIFEIMHKVLNEDIKQKKFTELIEDLHEKQVEALSESINQLSQSMNEFNVALKDEHEKQVEALSKSISQLSGSMNQFNDALKAEHDKQVEALSKSISQLSQSMNQFNVALKDEHDKQVAEHDKLVEVLPVSINQLSESMNQFNVALEAKHKKQVEALSKSISQLSESMNQFNVALEAEHKKQKGGSNIVNSHIDYTINDSTQMRINNLVLYNIVKFVRYKYYIKNSDSMNIYGIIFKDYFISLILSILLYISKMEKLSLGIIIDQVLSIGAFYKYKDHKYLLLPYYIAFL